MRKLSWILLPALALLCLGQARAAGHRRPLSRLAEPISTERIFAGSRIVYPPYPVPAISEQDLVGDTVTVGTTWFDYQHDGETGRMIVQDNDGFIHIVWTNGQDAQNITRHVFYNVVGPNDSLFFTTNGRQVDTAYKTGYTCMAVNTLGQAYVAYQQRTSSSMTAPLHAAVGLDVFPRGGEFQNFEIPWQSGLDSLQYVWPKITMKQDGQILVLSKRSNPTDHTLNWTVGTTDSSTLQITFTAPQLTESTTASAHSVGASHVSNKVGAAWTADPVGTPWANPCSDIHAVIDQDGLNLNLTQWTNVTGFYPPDPSFFPDTLLAEGDTLAAYTDCDVFFDQSNYCHLTFTTIAWFTIEELTYYNASMIWTWSEQYPNEFHVVARAWDPEDTVYCGEMNVKAQRPSMGQDPSTGYLYCMYQQFDTSPNHLSHAGYPSADIYVSVSTDGGRTWAQGTNVTNTVTPRNAPAGQCLSETFPSMAEKVDGFCHITYILDLDAGASVWTQGDHTFNPVKYQRVPVGSIATSPLMVDTPFHVQHISPVSPDPGNSGLPGSFTLEQNSPNPFNPSTGIRFSLRSQGDVTLSVYNLSGQKVATLVRGVYAPGTHSVTFEAAHLASGIYIYRLQVGDQSLQKKMLLVK